MENKKSLVLRRCYYFQLFLLLVFSLTACVTPINARKSFAKVSNGAPLDVIIVPGLPYDTTDMPGLMKYRMYWAKLLYDSGIARNVIFSGSSVYTPYKEGVVMKIMADSIGIPAYRTFAETKAEHSTENLYYSWKMARQLGFTRIGLATDPFQMLLLKRYKKKYFKDVQLVPVYIKMIDWEKLTLPEINAQPAFVDNFVYIKDRESVWNRWRATLGKRVRDDLKNDQHQAWNSATNNRGQGPYSSD